MAANVELWRGVPSGGMWGLLAIVNCNFNPISYARACSRCGNAHTVALSNGTKSQKFQIEKTHTHATAENTLRPGVDSGGHNMGGGKFSASRL